MANIKFGFTEEEITKLNAEREAKERAEREVKELAEREAKELTEREAKELAEREANERAKQESKERTAPKEDDWEEVPVRSRPMCICRDVKFNNITTQCEMTKEHFCHTDCLDRECTKMHGTRLCNWVDKCNKPSCTFGHKCPFNVRGMQCPIKYKHIGCRIKCHQLHSEDDEEMEMATLEDVMEILGLTEEQVMDYEEALEAEEEEE